MCQITALHILKRGVDHLWGITGGTAYSLTSRPCDRKLRTQKRPAVNFFFFKERYPHVLFHLLQDKCGGLQRTTLCLLEFGGHWDGCHLRAERAICSGGRRKYLELPLLPRVGRVNKY